LKLGVFFTTLTVFAGSFRLRQHAPLCDERAVAAGDRRGGRADQHDGRDERIIATAVPSTASTTTTTLTSSVRTTTAPQ